MNLEQTIQLLIEEKPKNVSRSRSIGRPPKWVSQSSGLSNTNPKALMKNLGISSFSGKSTGSSFRDWKQFLEQVVLGTDAMKEAFGSPKLVKNSSGQRDGILIPTKTELRYLNKYIQYALDGARNLGWLTLDEDMKVQDLPDEGGVVLFLDPRAGDERHFWFTKPRKLKNKEKEGKTEKKKEKREPLKKESFSKVFEEIEEEILGEPDEEDDDSPKADEASMVAGIAGATAPLTIGKQRHLKKRTNKTKKT